MGWFDDGQAHADALNQAQPDQFTPHEGHFTHEAVAGGAAFIAMREWEQHQAAEGKTVNHQLAKEMLAGLVGGEVDKLCETKGMDFIDREKAKRHAKEQVTQMYDDRHGYQQEGQQFQQPQGGWGYQQGQGQGQYGGFQSEQYPRPGAAGFQGGSYQGNDNF